MRQYFSKRYAPNNMVVACAGNLDWDPLAATLEATSGRWSAQPVQRPLTDFAGTKRKGQAEKPNLKREHICLMHTGVSAQDPRRYAAALLGLIIGDDYGSRFFWELVDKALVEEASMHFGPMDGTGLFYSYLCCSADNAGRVMDIISGIFQDLARNGISEEELVKAKNKVLSALVIKNEVPMGRLVDLGFHWMYLGEYRSIEQDVEAVKSVEASQVNSLIRQIDLNSYTQYILGPAGTA
jgi:predicted Zn-dependent peptidase